MRSKFLYTILIFLLVLGLVPLAEAVQPSAVTELPAASDTPAPAQPPQAERQMPPWVRELSPEVVAGLDELAPESSSVLPRALSAQGVADSRMMLVVELEQAPLATYFAQQKNTGRLLATGDLQSYHSNLETIQAAVQSQLEALGVQVVSNYTTVYNGFLAYVPQNQVDAIRRIPGVVGVHRAPLHVPALSNSVPLIGVPDVWEELDYDGTGVVIAIVDTGIDYTHVVFGGSGNPADFRNNNPNVVEPGTFPTTKVIAGYDFAGTLYNAGCSPADQDAGRCSRIPRPDRDPLDENGHGTHVASIAAGQAAGRVSSGVAPGAKLMALKVFGVSGSTNLVMNALDMATYNYLLYRWPQVINMSLGAAYGPGDDMADPDIVATNNAVAAGIVVVASAGNSSDVIYSTGSPGNANKAIGVASSEDGFSMLDGFVVTAPASLAGVKPASQSTAYDWRSPALPITGTLVYPEPGPDPARNQRTGCYPFNEENRALISGKIVLLDWNTPSCGGSAARSANAVAAGAIGVLIADDSVIFDLFILGSPVVPAYSIPKPIGDALKAALATEQVEVVMTAQYQGSVPYEEPIATDIISAFSSRGPRGTDSRLKPEITAPGGSIFAAAMGSGTGGTSLNGTSMAAPHVAGVAALMVQAHPDWTPEKIKAAMMNTALDLADGSPIPRQGAGRVDAYRAVSTPVYAVGDADFVSISGYFATDRNTHVIARPVTIHNTDTITHTYTVSWERQGASLQGLAVALSDDQVIVGPGATTNITATFTFTMTELPARVETLLEEIYGYIVFTPHEPILAITKTVETAQTPVRLGDVVTYTVSISNTGAAAAQGVVVTDTLLAGLVGQGLDETVDIPAGQSVTYTYTATVTTDPAYYGQTITNTVHAQYDTQHVSASASLQVRSLLRLYLPLITKSSAVAISAAPLSLLSQGNALQAITDSSGATTLAQQAPQGPLPAEDILRVPFYFVPRPYNKLEIAAQTTINDIDDDWASFEITHTGPISSSLWVYPLLVSDTKETGTAGDIKAIGVDYGWTHPTLGPIVTFAVSAWAPWHLPHFYFAEFDIYIDNNEDGEPDFVIYNAPVTGTNSFVPRVINLRTGAATNSPFPIYVDFNSAYMELYVRAAQLGLGATNTTFDFQVYGFDYYDNRDVTARGRFDYARAPFAWDADTLRPGPAAPNAMIEVLVRDAEGYAYSQPKGVMIVDYTGNPANGGETYLFDVTVNLSLDLTILHTNDFHARVDEYHVNGARCKPADATAGNCIGGAPRLATAVQAIREAKPNVLLLDAGDQFQGTLFYNLFKGDVLTETMNYLGYDAMTLGNHEFDNGPTVLANFIAGANFPVVSANVDVTNEPALKNKIAPYVVLKRGGHRIGIVGVTTPDTPNISSPGPNIVFNDPVTSLQTAVNALKAQGVNKIIVLTHLGYAADVALAAQVTDVDIIIGGHSHSFLYTPMGTRTFSPPNLTLTPVGDYPTVVGGPAAPVLVVTAYQWGTFLGNLDVAFNANGVLTAWSGNPIYISRTVAKDTTLDTKLQPYRDAVASLIATPVGSTTVDLPISVGGRRICRLGECLMGNLVADAMLWKANEFFPGANYQIAFQNGGGLRAPIAAGTVTMGDVMETLPFGNAIATFELKGEYVKLALENGARLYPSENGGFAQVAGMKYVIDPTQAAGSRITSVEVWNGTAWVALDPNAMYKVVTNDFMRRGGDGYTMFRDHAVNPYDFGPALDEALADYFQTFSPVTPVIEGRITGVPVP